MDLLLILLLISLLPLFLRQILPLESMIFLVVLGGIALVCLVLRNVQNFTIYGGGLTTVYGFPEMFIHVQQLFEKSFIFFLLGNLATSLFLRERHLSTPQKLIPFSTNGDKIRVIPIFIILSCLLISVYLIKEGSLLLKRDTYLFASGGSLTGNIHYFMPMIGSVAFYFFFVSKIGRERILLLLLSVVPIFVSLCSASRSVAIGIILMTGIFVIHIQGILKRLFVTVIGFLISSVATNLVLELRNLDGHGLIPYAHAIVGGSIKILPNWGNVTGNFFSTIPVTYLGSQIKPPNGMLSVAFSPFTGKSNGWYEMAGALMINPWTPSGAIAQIASLGPVKLGVTWFLLGVSIYSIAYGYKQIPIFEIRFVSYALTIGALVQMLQYSARNGARYLYMNLLFMITMLVIYKFYSNTARNQDRSR